MQTPSERVARPQRRRALACVQCRRKKLKCDHGQPCSNCSRARKKTCTYAAAADTTAAGSATPEPLPNRSSVGDPVARPTTNAASREIVAERNEPIRTDLPGTPSALSGERWVPSAVASLLLPSEGSPRGLPTYQDKSKTIPISNSLDGLAGPVRGAIFKSRFVAPSNFIHAILLVCSSLTRLPTFCL